MDRGILPAIDVLGNHALVGVSSSVSVYVDVLSYNITKTAIFWDFRTKNYMRERLEAGNF